MADKDVSEITWRRNLRWGLAGSVLLHVLFFLAMIVLIEWPQDAPEETEVAVTLVPPPEPEEPLQEEEPQPPPPEEEPSEEQAEAPPPPPQEAMPPLPTRIPLPTLRPVVQFGEKDQGPREALDGSAAEDKSQEQADTEQPETKPEPVETAEQTPEEAEEPAAEEPVPDGAALLSAEDGEPMPGAETPAEDPTATVTETAEEATEPVAPSLDKVETLFSTRVSDDPIAMTAMGNLPRGVRADQLCLTELKAQLLNSTPPYQPELLPSHRLGEGTVYEILKAAFRADSRWYELSFRCEVDADATRVVSFAFHVGKPIPRSEWRARGFPVF